MKSSRILKLLTLLIVAINFIVHINRPVYAITPAVAKGDIVINEINWAGSIINNKSESDDEWIELFNTTADNLTVPSTEIYIGTTKYTITDMSIPAQGYYVISRWGVDKSASTISNKISLGSISNSGFQIKLQIGGVVIDEVNTGGKAPTAGSNDTSGKATMARITPKSDGLDLNSWKTTTTRKNMKKGADFCRNYGTPGAENFPATTETVIEFEDSCTSGLQYSDDKNSVILNTKGESTFEFGSYDFGNETALYELQLNYLSIRKDITSSYTFNLNFNPDNSFSFEKTQLSENTTPTQKLFKFIKSPILSSAALSITTNLTDGESIALDSIIIRKPQNENGNYSIKDPEFPYASTKEIGLNKENFRVSFTINFISTRDTTNLLDKVGTFTAYNPLTKSLWSKSIYNKDISLNKDTTFSYTLISDTLGYYRYEFTPAKQISYKITELKVEKETKQSIHDIDPFEIITPNTQFTYLQQTQNIFFEKTKNQPSKLLQLQTSPLCALNTSCSVTINVKTSHTNDSIVNPQIVDLFFAGADKNNKKFHVIKHLYANDFKDTSSFDLTLPYPNLEEVSFSLFSYENADIEIGKLTLKEKELPATTPQSNQISLKSTKSVDWSKSQTISHEQFNGKLIDILKPQTLNAGEYTFTMRAKKSAVENSGDDLVAFTAYDEIGKKLFDRTIEDDDLSSFETITFTDSFTLTNPADIHIVIKFANGEWYDGASISVEGVEMVRK